MFAALLFASALAAEPVVLADRTFDPWTIAPAWRAERIEFHEPDHRRSKLVRTSTGLVIAGAVTTLAAFPIGVATTGIASATMCGPESYECMGPAFLGAGTAIGLGAIGLSLATAGGIGFAVDAGRKGRERRMELSVTFAPDRLIVGGSF